jgi:hypothetical protein
VTTVERPRGLPPDERVLWHGAPAWWSLAKTAFHVRKLAAYFALLLAWRGATVGSEAGSVEAGVTAALEMAPLPGVALLILVALARMSARTTAYWITDRRVVMRIGIVLTITLNLPFKVVAGAALRRHADGAGDIPLALAGGDRVAYLVLWPHARPWRLLRPEPMLRALPDAVAAATVLATALARAHGQPVEGPVAVVDADAIRPTTPPATALPA